MRREQSLARKATLRACRNLTLTTMIVDIGILFVQVDGPVKRCEGGDRILQLHVDTSDLDQGLSELREEVDGGEEVVLGGLSFTNEEPTQSHSD